MTKKSQAEKEISEILRKLEKEESKVVVRLNLFTDIIDIVASPSIVYKKVEITLSNTPGEGWY